MTKKSSKLLSILLLLALLVSCGGGGNGSEQGEPSQTGDYQKITLSKNADLNTMDAQIATDGLSFEIIQTQMEGLMTVDEKGVPDYAMAESYEISDDQLHYTFKIRDAQWENGDPVTAHDFVYGWQRLGTVETEYAFMLDVCGVKNGGAVSRGDMPATELGIRALDDKTLEVELERVVPFFLKLMSWPSFFPANQAFVEAQGDQYGLTPETTIGNGPFVWKEWYSGSNVVMQKSDTYWDKDNVQLDEIEFKVALDAQSAVLDYASGNTDYVVLDGELVDKYKDEPGFSDTIGAFIWYLSTNHTLEKFDNKNLMHAIALAFNREQIANNVLKDGSMPGYYFVIKNLARDSEGNDFREVNGDFFTEGKDKAKEYWEAAKEELGIDTFEFELLFEDSEQSKKVAEFLKSEIETTLPGMSVSLKSQPKKTRLQLMNDNEFEIGLTRWGPDYADPMTTLEVYESYRTHGKYVDEHYDELLQLARSGEQTAEERWQTMAEAEKYLLDGLMGPIPVYQSGGKELWNPKLKGVITNLVSIPNIYKHAYLED